MALSADEQMEFKVRVSNIFRPGTPINHQKLFAGRQSQVNDVLNATLQPGRHIVMFGERGVGKTSLARIISAVVSQSGHALLDCHTINCDGTDDFSSLFRKIFREISFVQGTKFQGFSQEQAAARVALDQILPDRTLQPDDVRYVLTRLGTPALIVIDEVDKLSDRGARRQLADTIKTLSDHAVPATLMLIGVADSVEELIAEHQSIERALVQVPMQRMSRAELMQIVSTGLNESGLTAEEGVESWTSRLSQGLPHYTHSLSLYAAFTAIQEGRTHIAVTDVLAATKTMVEKSHTLRTAYNNATGSPQQQSLYGQVLRACALADTDELGYFRASALTAPMTTIMRKKYDVPSFRRHLFEFCEVRRGPVLKRIGEPRSFKFRFVDPMMQPFVIVHDYSINALTNELLRKSRGRTAE